MQNDGKRIEFQQRLLTRLPVPFLAVRDDFHQKRNQARQTFATLPISRFEDLSSDVYFELTKRYPEFTEEPVRLTSLFFSLVFLMHSSYVLRRQVFRPLHLGARLLLHRSILVPHAFQRDAG